MLQQEYLAQQKIMDCMAGTETKKTKKQSINSTSRTANLNITFHSTSSNISCCLWLQQPQVVESNNSNKPNSNNRLMKQNSTRSCHNSSCTLDDRILTNYNYNIKTKHQPTKQRPLTLSLAVIIISLTILLIQMPTMVHSRSTTYEEAAKAKNIQSVAETSAESDSKLLLSLLADAEPSKQISSLTDELSSDSLDMLTSLDVIKHIQRTQRHQRERKMRKRHLGDLLITKYLHETGHNSEWKNPCNVDYVNLGVEARHATKQQVIQYLRKFEHDVGMEYELISATANTININDMADWSKHDELYKFLPKLNANGSIALSRWYRNMQVYVASFGYLARSEYNFDQKKRMFVGSTSEELNKLLASARFILCELETTINGSAPNNNLKKLRTISRRAMNNRLNFVTKHQLANGGIVAANTVDLKFAKFFYYEFLLNMQKILHHKLQNKAKKYGAVTSLEDNKSVNSNNVMVGDDTSSLDFSSIFKSDSSLSLGESVEILFKTTQKPHTQRRRIHKKKVLLSTEN